MKQSQAQAGNAVLGLQARVDTTREEWEDAISKCDQMKVRYIVVKGGGEEGQDKSSEWFKTSEGEGGVEEERRRLHFEVGSYRRWSPGWGCLSFIPLDTPPSLMFL